MRAPASLSGRLLAGAAVFVVVALLLAGGAIALVLSHFIHGQIDQRLDGELHAIAEAMEPGPDGQPILRRNVDAPPFDRPRSDWAWQATGPTGVLARSRSLGGDVLPMPEGPLPALPPPPPSGLSPAFPPGEPAGHPEPPLSAELRGVADQLLIGRAVRTEVGGFPVSILATAPIMALHGPVRDALVPVALCLAALGFALVAAVLLQVRLGLQPLGRLRHQLGAIRTGQLESVPGPQPREIAPLVHELNALLAENAENLASARRHASNLAHGLKTPLATLALAIGSDGPDRTPLRPLLDQMDRQIRHHLGRARAAALGGGPLRVATPLAPAVSDLADAFGKIHADKAVTIGVIGLAGVSLACERQDLDEMLGNLLDNACRFARARVRVSGMVEGRLALVSVEDDGPGLPDDAVAAVLRPGQRLDESSPGYGFGLPITRDIASLYGGSLGLDRSPLGGLRATLRLPAAQAG